MVYFRPYSKWKFCKDQAVKPDNQQLTNILNCQFKNGAITFKMGKQ